MTTTSKSLLPLLGVAFVGVSAVGLGMFAAGRASAPVSTPTASSSISAPPSPRAEPTSGRPAPSASSPRVVLHEWPGARGGEPGLYFWDMFGGDWMHNPAGRGVGASLEFATGGTPFEGSGEAVTVAGHDAIHRLRPVDAVGMVREQWIIQDIGNQTVFITLAYSHDAEPSGIVAARDVIASLVLEKGPTPSGFMLVFVNRGDWDSG